MLKPNRTNIHRNVNTDGGFVNTGNIKINKGKLIGRDEVNIHRNNDSKADIINTMLLKIARKRQKEYRIFARNSMILSILASISLLYTAQTGSEFAISNSDKLIVIPIILSIVFGRFIWGKLKFKHIPKNTELIENFATLQNIRSRRRELEKKKRRDKIEGKRQFIRCNWRREKEHDRRPCRTNADGIRKMDTYRSKKNSDIVRTNHSNPIEQECARR